MTQYHAQPEDSRMGHQPAFTLIELLVVVAIIVVLVALLLPAETDPLVVEDFRFTLGPIESSIAIRLFGQCYRFRRFGALGDQRLDLFIQTVDLLPQCFELVAHRSY